jgi:gliding motility-associated-like protein
MISKKGSRNVLTSLVLAFAVCVKSFAQGFNFPPLAVSDSTSTMENVAVTINVTTNDRDSTGNLNPSTVDLDVNVMGIQKVFATAKGNYRVDSLGVVTFTPANGYFGRATIAYNVRDSLDAVSNNANIHVDVEAVNGNPVAAADNGQTNQNTDITIKILDNDSDPDGFLDTTKVDLDPVAPGIQRNKKNPEGDWSANKGEVKFKPKKDFSGTAKVDYTVTDNEGAISNVVSITVTVVVPNKAPVAVNDTGGTTLNKPVSINVVSNDSDPDGTIDIASVDLNTGTAGIQNTINTGQGSWSVNATGVVTYTPIALFLGSATLNYFVSDNKGMISNSGTITITVQALNIPPMAVNDNATTTKNKAVTIKVTDNDTDIDGTVDVTKVDLNTTLAGVQNTSETTEGVYSASNTGVVTYTPANNFTGFASLAYTVNDNAGGTSNQATINITVQNVNSPPVAVNDNGATSQNTAVTVNVVTNDTDSDGVIDAAKVDLNTTTAGVQNTNSTNQGNYSVTNLGIVTYTPAKDFTGSATLNYAVSDNSGASSNVASITIAVQPVNAPVANEDVITTKTNLPVDINVLTNDRDSDGTIDATSVDLNTTTAGVQNTATTPGGNFSVNDQGVVRFVPKTDYFGQATVKYTVKDNKGVLSNAASIFVTIEEVPDIAPEITAFEEATDTLRYTPGRPVQFTELFEVTDEDDDSLAVAEVALVSESYVIGNDLLLFTSTSTIKGSFDAQTGVLTLTGLAPIQQYNAAIRSVQYSFAGEDEFDENIKEVYVRVSDGTTFSDLKSRVIKVNSALTDLDIPTAFTPNSDGANDTWKILTPITISGSDFADAEVRVYDKRGTVVFGVNGLGNSWDGTYQGKLLPVDTYYYTIDLKQQQKRYRGVVAILR